MNQRELNNALAQLNEFGKIRITYYQNRNYETGGAEMVFNSISELNDFFNHEVGCNDDTHIPHPNYFN